MLAYWKLITMPIVGAIIGYITNWIAVKMLFRPRKEIFLFGKRLPFTPGVIPKGKARLAKAVGRAVEQQLLTEAVLREVLLSEEKKAAVREAVRSWTENKKESKITLRATAEQILSKKKAEDFIKSAEETVTDVVFDRLLQMDVGEIIADKVLEIAREKLKDSMFGMMLGGSILDPITRQVEEKINEYVAEHGRSVVEQMVLEESEKLQEKTMGDALCQMEACGVNFPDLAVGQYEVMISDRLPQALRELNVASIVEDRINAMDVEEVEELMLSIMKRELGAVVNLGALIGLILGLINAVILYI